MHILVVKTSSLGDIIHCLPALYDLKQHDKDIKIDFLVEKSFADIVKSSHLVDNVIEIEFRKWRKKGLLMFVNAEFNQFRRRIKQTRYDLIIDAQGLFKSAYLASLAHGKIVGFDKLSARERLSNLFYATGYQVDKNQHAIKRLRQLFAKIFNYQFDIDNSKPVFFNKTDSVTELAAQTKDIKNTDFAETETGIDIEKAYAAQEVIDNQEQNCDVVFLHGTTWQSKLYPIEKWRTLAQLIHKHYPSLNINLLYGNDLELDNAQQIITGLDYCHILQPKTIAEIITMLSTTKVVIAVDTGLAHLAAAMGVATIGLYGSTDYLLTGIIGDNIDIIYSDKDCSPCLKKTCQIAENNNAVCMNELEQDRIIDFIDKAIG